MLNTQFFDSHFSRIRSLTPVETLVVIGAGQIEACNLQTCLDSQVKTIVLTEADAIRAAELRSLCADAPTSAVHLRETAIAEQRGQQEHHVFNLASLSGLHPAPALQRLFPGLRQIRVETVQTETMMDLLRAHPLMPDDSNVLVLGVLGEEARVLEQLRRSKDLARFSHIFVVIPPALDQTDILGRLRQSGWDVYASDTTDPDFPSYLLQVNEAFLEIEALNRQLAEARTQRTEQAAELEKLRAELKTAHADMARQTKTKEAELEKLRAELKAAHADMARQTKTKEAELEKLRAELKTAHADMARQTKTKEAELEKLRAELKTAHADMARQTKTKEAELEKLHAELKAAHADMARQTKTKEAELEKLHAELKAAHADMARQTEEMKKQTDLTQQSLTMALRMQDLRETDLRELQLRYGELKARKEAQDHLLHRLQNTLSGLLPSPTSKGTHQKAGHAQPVGKKKPRRSKKSTAR